MSLNTFAPKIVSPVTMPRYFVMLAFDVVGGGED